MVVQKLATGVCSPNVSNLISAVVTLEKGEAKIRPIAIGVIMRRLITEILMPASISEAKGDLEPIQVGCGVISGLDSIFHDTGDVFSKLR